MTIDSKTVVANFYRDLGEGKVAEAFARLSPRVRWTYHGPADRLPFAGTFTGPQGVGDFFARFGAVAEPLEMSTVSIALGDDGVIYARGVERSRAKSGGHEYSVQWVHVITLAGGLIASFDEYLDSASVVAALGC